MKGQMLFFFGLLLFAYQSSSAQIIGDTIACTNEALVYRADTVPGATYSWRIANGAAIAASTNDSITIRWTSFDTVGLVTVTITPLTGQPILDTLEVSLQYSPRPFIVSEDYDKCYFQFDSFDILYFNYCAIVCKGATLSYSTTNTAGSSYLWQVTGGAIVSGAGTNEITINWDDSDEGEIKLIETNVLGCIGEALYCVLKEDVPVAAFTHLSNACKFAPVTFHNQSTGATNTKWYFGDGTSSTDINPTHAYSTAGTYTVTLVVSNNCYCTDTLQSTITIDAFPGPEITCLSTLCSNDTSTYATTPSAGCNYNWFVAGGTILSGAGSPNITVAWGAGQIGQVGLNVSTCAGVCSDTTIIEVPLLPSVAVISGPTIICAQTSATFSVPRFTGTRYVWTVSNTDCFNSSYSYPGSETFIFNTGQFYQNCDFTISVAYYNEILGCSGTASIVVNVRPQYAIYGDNLICRQFPNVYRTSPYGFSEWSISPAGPLLLNAVGDSTIIDVNGAIGNYTLRAINSIPGNTCKDTTYFPITIIDAAPTPTITGDTLVCPQGTYIYCAPGANFIVSGGTVNSTSGSCVTVTWGSTPPYAIKAFIPGNYISFCHSDTTEQIIHVQPATSPNIIGPSASCANATEQFSLSSSYPINTVYQWSLNPANAGTIVSQNGGSVQIEWGNNAPQNVSLSVSFQACGSVLGSTKVVSLNSVPLPFVTQIGTFCKGGSVQLQVSGGTFANINWTGPNNFSGNGNSINITEEGLYQVIVVDASGCLARTQYNASYVTGPIAKISTFDFTTFCAGSSYSVNLCALGNDDYLYSWSNGQTGQCSAVTSAANYAVTITDASNGCTSVSNIIDVSEVICSGGSGPGIPINPSGPSCLPPTGTVSFNYTNCNPINFVNNSVNASNFAWQFGDDSTSTQTNPSHQYAEAGYYLAFLLGDLASNNGSGSCRFFDTAHVVVPLLAIFDVSSSCFGEPICFTDKSVFTFGNDITNWSWDFGDGTIANTRNYCNTYTTPGTYIVTLTVSNSTCATSVSDTIIVSAPPIASFNAPSNACVNTLLNFSNTSTGNTTSWNWDFGNNGTSLKQNPTYTYDAIGTYNVSFVAGNNYGCTDTLTSAITISSPNLSGAITAFPDTIVCPGEEILLSAPTCGNCTYLWSDGSNGSTLTVTSSGNYKLTINDANNCPYITAKSVTVRNVPNATIIYSNTVLCNSVELSTNRSNNFTYYWTANDGVNNGKTTSSISGTLPGGTYIYQLIVTDTTTGCVDTSQPVNITVVPFAAPTITEISSGPYCEDDFVTLVASHPDTSVTFVWDYSHPGDTYVGNLWYQNSFQVVATNNYGCVRSATEYFSAGPHNLTSNFYEGCLDTCQGFVIKGPSGSASYQWLLNGNTIAGATDSTYLPTQNGAYSVIVATDFGCVDTTGVMELTLRECPDLCLNAGPEGSVAVLEAGLKAFPDSMTYQWTLGPPNYTVISGATNQLFTPSGSDTYCAIITNGLGCKDTVCAAWVGIEGIQALEWNLFPNPNNGKFTINVGSHTNETVEIRVVNTLGEIVISRPLELSDHKSSSYVLDVNVASGIYFVQLISVNGAYTRRVVIE